MGGNICKGSSSQLPDISTDPLEVLYGEDPKQNNIIHNRSLVCNNPQLQKILEQFGSTLKNNKTLYKDPYMHSQPIILKSRTQQFSCTYERPYKFLEGNIKKGQPYRLIDQHQANADNIQVKDQVMQYFGVFLCFLADKPTLIKKIINTQQNGYGIHSIEAYFANEIKRFVIDDYILCKKGQPVFSQPYKMMYMWTCLLEKAWLKLKGNSSKKVQQNNPDEVFNTFLPIPIQKIYLQNGPNNNIKQTIHNTFQYYDRSKQKGYILTSKKDPEHSIGLSGRKHFYLLDTFIEDGKRLFYIRNPCDQQNFRGFYKNVPKQIEQRLYQHRFLSIAPGNFIIDQDEFIEQIDQIMIAQYTQGNTLSTFTFNVDNGEQFFIGFDLRHRGTLNLCLSQINKGREKAYFPILYHVIRLADLKVIGGMNNQEGCFGSKYTYLLDRFNEDALPGKYLIRLKKKQTQRTLQGIKTSLISYNKDSIKFDIISSEELSEKWKQFLYEEGHRKLQESKNKKKETHSTDVSHVVCWLGDLVYIYVEKKNQKRKDVQIEVNFPELMNLHCVSHPQIKRSNQFISLSFEDKDKLLIIFEKMCLAEETHIRKYHLEAF